MLKTYNTSSGVPMHHYDMNQIKQDRKDYMVNSNIPLDRRSRRKRRRKLEKIATKYGGYVEEY